MTTRINAASSGVKVSVEAPSGLPADFVVTNDDGNVVGFSVDPWGPGQTSVGVTITRKTNFNYTARLHAKGTGFQDTPLDIVVEAKPPFTWREDTAVQIP